MSLKLRRPHKDKVFVTQSEDGPMTCSTLQVNSKDWIQPILLVITCQKLENTLKSKK